MDVFMRKSKYFYTIISFLTVFSQIRGDNGLIVNTEQGKLRGFNLKSRNGTEYRAFLAIPYAKPPVDELRFQPPQKPDTWTGIRDATSYSSKCIQEDVFFNTASFSSVEGEEDCLYLNVFSPSQVNSKSNLPVLVYVHGGGFVMGSASTLSADYFLDYDVVVATINYRLGPFGFLSTADTIMPGNYGMKDQSAALKWVKKNIAAFGGNPEQVTIFGESAGSASVHLHLYSPLSKGLFQRAISQSGSALSLWARAKPTLIRQKTLAFGILAGCSIESSEELLQCLRKMPAKDLVLIHRKLHSWDFEPPIIFSIVPEPKEVKDGFIYDDPWRQNPVNNVPWMTGITSAEGAIKAARYLSGEGQLLNELDDNYKRYIPLLLNLVNWLSYEDCQEMAEAIKQHYFGTERISFSTAKNLVDMISDGLMLYDCLEGVSQHTNSVYLYYYDHRNAISFSEFFGNCSLDLGVSHVDDLISLFPVPELAIRVSDGPDLNVSKRMIERWINFARTGNPNIGDKIWSPSRADKFNYLHITTTQDEMKNGLLRKRFLFWKNLLSKAPYVRHRTSQKELKEKL